MKRARVLFGLIAVLLSLSFSVFANIPNIQRQEFLSGLSSPVFITNAGDGTNRMFVVQQRGLIKVAESGSTTSTDFINLSTKVSQSGNERGLLGLAFHPDFENNSFFFVNYTRQSDGTTVIERFKATNNNTIGDQNSGQVIITIPQDFSNHNGGNIAFGHDGHLYIGMGDGGSGNDPNNNAQTISSLLGKMLRITPKLDDIIPAGTPAYTVPADNPYVGVDGADEIFAIGLRNPYRWSFDRGGTNQLWAADVGQFSIEEVSIINNGKNYGWRVYEGNSCTNNDPGLCTANNFEPPVFQYNHSGGRCSITGGYVYRGTQGTFPNGAYIYGDFCSGDYYYWDGSNQILIEDTPRSISSFGEDEAGELYLVNIGGTVEKIINTQPFINNTVFDFDGDNKTDISIFRPNVGEWWYLRSSDLGNRALQFGSSTDIPVPADFTGDSKTDITFWRNGEWFVLRSEDDSFFSFPFGTTGDIPAPGDFDGDGKADPTVFRPSEGVWFVSKTTGGTDIIPFGIAEDKPVVADYDGDGKDDIGIFRPSVSQWWINRSTAGLAVVQFGSTEDKTVPGDYTGDGKADIAFFRPSNGEWFIVRSEDNSFFSFPFGTNGDIAAPGDYDGDGTFDSAVFRPSQTTWYLNTTSNGVQIVGFGANGDVPIPSVYSVP